MADERFGRILAGNPETLNRAQDQWAAQPVDVEIPPADDGFSKNQTTIGHAVSVTGAGTFFGRTQRTLTFEPSAENGWAFSRNRPDYLPIWVSVKTVWTTARNIVLCSGSPHNYMRMVEHIVALKTGMGIDNLLIRVDSGDPPLFDRSSMDLVEAMEKAGTVESSKPASYWTVKEPVTLVGRNGAFLCFRPSTGNQRRLYVDCSVSFKSAIRQQRIRFPVNREMFRHGAFARTNAPLSLVAFSKTIGLLFADTRNLGYNSKNILVHSRWGYYNKPRMFHNGKSLEAAWHRATLDLLAAVALMDRGRFAGEIISYKAGHALDVDMIRQLYQHNLLTPLA
jgi:UDP-3-O-[3-hydroxymyristoyl] N-acetylglucosamine deacetylase